MCENKFYVCQHCGTKYSVEDARNLFVEVDDAVKIDNSEQIASFLALVESSYSSLDYAGTVNYCDKIIEIDPNNFDAWLYKAKSACWVDSNLDNIKIPSSLSAAKRAVNLAGEDIKTETADSIYRELKNNIATLLNTACKMPGASGCDYIHLIMVNWNNILSGIPNLSDELIEHEITECANLCKTSRRSILPSKRLVFATYFAYNNNESYDKMFRKSLGR